MNYSEAKIEHIDKKIVNILNKFATKEEIIYKKNHKGKKESRIYGLSKGIFFFGDTGIGKTFALHAIKHRLQDFGISVNLEKWVEMLLEFKDRMDYLRDSLNAICDKEVLMIDDLGTEKQTEWSQEILFIIIDRIVSKNKTLFISTNLSLEEFQQKYGDRIFSRVMGVCEPYEMKGEDRRLA
jgi:DNA replication protein DnaC